ncbi:monovalent cation:proton antiporter-2 (CPA2) family protein [Pseudomonas sp. NPDC088444]|uniref:monovalent cation:proton antiporter-2 (CPA2) family protein n=1 Tax=Pseudomonas sp. NPDC088444 TaxID=3364456 RepID=UPI00384E2E2D
MTHEASLLESAVIFLLSAVVTVLLTKRMQLGAVLGYLLAGVAIGPQALGLIGNPDRVSSFSELGVVLLLFVIGLELSPKRLWLMRKSVFGTGLVQVISTATVISVVAAFGFGLSISCSLIIGIGLALSSTAFGVQSLAESRQLQSPHGRLAFAILLFQDIAAIPLIAMLPLIGTGDSGIGESTGTLHVVKALACIAFVVVAGRYFIQPVFRAVARTGLPEVSTATALLVVVGTAWLMDKAGLSMALGTFIAGLLLSGSEYRHELASQIEPFKGLLLALFFMSVGMGANLELLYQSPIEIVGLAALLVLIKLPLVTVIGRTAGGLKSHDAVKLGMVLAAGGEFAFVVFQQGKSLGLINQLTYEVLTMTITLSMCLTPPMILAYTRLSSTTPLMDNKQPGDYANFDASHPRVVIAGMGRMGQIVARILRAQNVPFTALDTSVETIELIRSFERVPVFYGDPLRPEILTAANVGNADYFIVVNDDPDVSVRLVELVHRLYPHVKIIARARNRQHSHRLVDAGAEAIRETFYSSLEMTRGALVGMGMSHAHAERRIRQFAEHDEKVLALQRMIHEDEARVLETTHDARKELAELFSSDLDDNVKTVPSTATA